MEVKVTRQYVKLPENIGDKFKEKVSLSSDDKFSVSMVLLSAFIVLIKRYTDQDQLLVYPENMLTTEGQTGNSPGNFCSIIQADLSEDPGFAELALQLLHKMQTAQGICGETCDKSRTEDDHLPFVLRFSVQEEFEPIISSHDHERDPAIAKYAHGSPVIMLKLFCNSKGISGWIETRTGADEVFLPANVTDHYMNILEEAATDPGKKISAYSILNIKELHQFLYQWNDTACDYPDVCLHQLIEQQVERTPDAVAVICQGKKLTYRELNSRANSVAQDLLKRGIKPEDLVGVLASLSTDAVIAILGVLKAGAAYVPLDPDYPANRLQLLLEDARPEILMVEAGLKHLVRFGEDKMILMGQGDWPGRHTFLPNTVSGVRPENLAYVMYTSGSTGTPKGILIQHNSVVNNMMLVRKRYELTASDTVLSMPSLAFDASVSKLFPILTAGGAVVLPTEEEVNDIEKTLELIRTYRIPYFATTPSILKVLNAMDPDLSSMRVITGGGEALKFSDIDHIIRHVPVLNVYGPTEATVSSCTYKIPKNAAPIHSRIPIGKPNPNCRIYILDKHLNCMPAGCFGTLYIGGAGVARGYLNNPELTAQRFIRSPFVEGDVLYNTGDIARWLPDGNVDFLGRKDNQIKIRGFRIQTEEIEKVLLKHPAVRESKIIVRETSDGDKAMVACIAENGKDKITLESMKAFVEKYFPDYMIPSDIMIVEALPLNQNKKVDSKELLKMYESKAVKGVRTHIPKNILEKEITEFWKELLKREVHPQENFFHVGGHSLHAMKLKMFLNKKFHTDISMKEIFNNLTAEKLAGHILSKMQTEAAASCDMSEAATACTVGEVSDKKTVIPNLLKKSLEMDGDLNGINHLIQKSLQNRKMQEVYNFFFRKPGLTDLSFNEERLWFLYRFLPHRSIYNIVKAYRLTGKLNVQVLERSIKALVERHVNLRKNFMEVDGIPRAKINDKADFKIRMVNLTGFKKSSKMPVEAMVEKVIDEEIEKPFDLAKELPFRVSLVKVRDDKFMMIIAAHHIIADAWSFNILLEELDFFYNAHFTGEIQALPGLSEEYRNYVSYQRERITGERLQQLLNYWQNELRGKINRLKLPYDRTGKDINSYAGQYEEVRIPSSLISSLEKMSRNNHTTLFMTFFAAFQTLLYKYTMNEDIVTAIPMVDRQHPDSRRLAGFFVNTLLLPSNFSQERSFEQVLGETRKTILEAYHHQDIPFEILANALRKETGVDVRSLIQVMFAFQNITEPSFRLSNLSIEPVPLKNKYSRFDLTVSVSEGKDGYIVSAEYKSALFHQGTISRMLRAFHKLLETVAENPAILLSEINILDPSEKAVLQSVWNDTNRILPDFSVHELFERQAFLTPEAIAIHSNGHRVSYKELHIRSNQLAHYLLSKGIGREELVGILMQESDISVTAMLAILKAGGAYLPLDPSYPKERIAHMLEDSKVRFIITDSESVAAVTGDSYTLILTDKEREMIFSGNDGDVCDRVKSDSLAYVMYTSGSTGKPKGVCIEHKSIVRLVKNTNFISLDHHSRLLKTGAFSFDASTFEVWGMLLNGGELFIYPKENLLDPQFMKERIRKDHITVMWLTSSWFNNLVDIDHEMFGPLKALLAGGDKLSPKHIFKVKKAFPHLEIINGYGPTENTTFSLYYRVEGEETDDIPVGKPISNTTVYVLDESLNILPVGIQGEIYVGGKGVARGYMNDPELTAKKFIPDPFNPSGRLYKTGDLGRWLEDGNIEFAGRKDNQVKLRGYRIEPGEIENALTAHSQIEESVVLLHEEKPGNKQLVAFYKSETSIPDNDLKTFLRKTLPDFMIPALFIQMTSFPLTPNGKVNRQVLLNTSASRLRGGSRFEFASNATEERLVEIWEEVLSKEQVSVTDNFFELGGHSLLAARVMARIEKAFGKSYPLSLLFEAPTIRELAAVIKGEGGLKKSGIVPIQPHGSNTPIFLLPGYLFYYNLSKYLGDNQPLYGFEPLPLDKTEDIAAAYIKQIRMIQPEGPYYIGGFCASGIIAYEMGQQLLAAGHSVGMLTLFEVYTPEATVPKASKKYLHEKVAYWKATFTSTSLTGKFRMVYHESRKLFRYFFENRFRKILNTYTIKPYAGNIMLFKAKDGMVGSADDPYMGWSKFCSTERIEVVEIPGDHNTIFKEPNVGLIAAHLKRYVEKEKFHVEEI